MVFVVCFVTTIVPRPSCRKTQSLADPNDARAFSDTSSVLLLVEESERRLRSYRRDVGIRSQGLQRGAVHAAHQDFRRRIDGQTELAVTDALSGRRRARELDVDPDERRARSAARKGERASPRSRSTSKSRSVAGSPASGCAASTRATRSRSMCGAPTRARIGRGASDVERRAPPRNQSSASIL